MKECNEATFDCRSKAKEEGKIKQVRVPADNRLPTDKVDSSTTNAESTSNSKWQGRSAKFDESDPGCHSRSAHNGEWRLSCAEQNRLRQPASGKVQTKGLSRTRRADRRRAL